MAKGTIALGQFRGKVGGQVLRVVDGKQVIQSYQPHVRNPKTTAQEMQRAATRRLGQLMHQFIGVLRTSFGGVYPASEFYKSNISRQVGAFTILDPEDVQTNYSALKIARGNAGGLIGYTAGLVDYGSATHLSIQVPLSNVTVGGDLDINNARFYVVAYCPDRGLAVLGAATPSSALKMVVNVPADWDGMEVHVWSFATCAVNDIDPDAYDQTSLRLSPIISDGQYLGSGEVA